MSSDSSKVHYLDIFVSIKKIKIISMVSQYQYMLLYKVKLTIN